jgi:hypothetical protein
MLMSALLPGAVANTNLAAALNGLNGLSTHAQQSTWCSSRHCFAAAAVWSRFTQQYTPGHAWPRQPHA